MLRSRRVAHAERAQREAAGESFWRPDAPEPVRRRLLYLVEELIPNTYVRAEIYKAAARLLMIEYGVPGVGTATLAHHQFEQFFLRASDEQYPDAVEALFDSLHNYARQDFGMKETVAVLTEVANSIFEQDRVAWDVVGVEMVPKESQEMHHEVVAPTLRLLSGLAGFTAVEAAYQDALGELAAGKPDDAITDAGTALQETLTALGYNGNALGPLIRDARAKGAFAGHDENLINTVASWVSADRSTKGDAHSASTATHGDGWLTVHIVGALILRLARGGQRAEGA